MRKLAMALGLTAVSLVSGCQTAPATPTGVWYLTGMGEGDAPRGVTLEIAPDLSFSGQAPCNTYRGQASLEGGTFSIGPIMATRMACEDLDAEVMYLTYLGAVQAVATDGDRLLLTTAQGVLLSFTR